MSVAPIVRSLTVKASPARAFEIFTRDMGLWWPHGRTLGKPHAAIVIEPGVGGAWFERDEAGVEVHWGNVLVWEPPSRLVLAWRLTSQWTYDPDFETEVELTFAPADPSGAIVTFEHRNLERYGADATRVAGQVGPGWVDRLDDYAAFANTHS